MEQNAWVRILAVVLMLGLTSSLIACSGGSGDSAPPPMAMCSATALPSGAADATLQLAAWPDRDYDLVLPASHQCGTPIAVVVVLHGGGGNKDNMRQTVCPGGDISSAACLHRQALASGMAVVFANGTRSGNGSGGGVRTWNAGGGQNGFICVSGPACASNVDDLGYIRALIADLNTHIAVDPKRVFASGFSNGAALTQRLACEAADVFAAIAPVSGENQFALAGCAPLRSVAVLDIHGTLDSCWPYDGGLGGCVDVGQYVSVGSTLSGWVARNACQANPAVTTLPPLPGIDDGTSVVRYVWPACATDGAVEHLQIVGGGHFWPNGFDLASVGTPGGVLSRQLDASQAIVVFFAAHGRS